MPDLLRRSPHPLQIRSSPGLSHGDRANEFSRGELWQPTLLLIFGAVVKDVRSHNSRMQRCAESIESGERKFAVDHRFVGEGSTGAAVFLRH